MTYIPNSKSIDPRPDNPGTPIALNSRFYIERPPCEERAYQEIATPGSLIRIRGPRQMGKTSFLLRLINYTKTLDYRIITIDFLQTDTAVFESTEKFLRWFCINLSRQLKSTYNIDDYWDEDIGYKVCCTIFVEELLHEVYTPVVLIFKEVNCVFKYTKITQDFLPLLRFWHEQARIVEIWKKLRLVLVHATEIYVSLSVNQSPFNLGLPIKLSEFTLEQVKDFAQRYGLKLPEEQIQELMNLVGGHPYLVHLALDNLYHHNLTFEELLRDAPTQRGIYSDYLRSLWIVLQKQPTLAATFTQLITEPTNIQLEPMITYQLENLGLVKIDGNICVPCCKLYSLYFQGQKLGQTSDRTVAEKTKNQDYQNPQVFTNINSVKMSNHDFFNFYTKIEWNNIVAENYPIALILGEIDNYQVYKNQYGTKFSHNCLQVISKKISLILQDIHNVHFNKENEQFIMILPKIDGRKAIEIAEIIIREIKELTLSPDRDMWTNFPNSIVTMSMGIACTIPSENEHSSLFLAAEEALFESQEQGDCVTLSSFLNYQDS
ncbi:MULTISPECIES: AAA-like domain-containing protein [unclassified Okeania]|uniref:AAA-like domain-containing protein n=1 Tax=unclassified Okeania TaxID=2634635 RepID=UPI0013B82E85|nr:MULTISPECIES: AAA-like domain-containing protein [unclassified Okeania]NES76151.1 diguanylate cyclase [Okeania sp. SIO1H4]NET19594.1 diguanylate cyclase [Okeania sp. SIO1H5]NET93331.1 diguanylate cyclase [Okeania sp. SIO1H2]